MRKVACSILLVVCLAIPVLAQPAAAPAEAQGQHAAAVSFVRTLIQAALAESGTPGMSVAVGVGGKLVWAEGFGYADLEQRVPVWDETRFRIGSVSKPVTGAAVGLLVEQGKLDLDAPVQRYVPSFPEKPWPVTTRQAAGHTAGIRHYNGNEFLSSDHYPTVLEGLTIFQDDDLRFEPGTRFAYSSYGWNLVSAVVESAAGEPFLDYMQSHVFDALDMNDTDADHNSRIIPHRTRFYVKDDDGNVVNAPYVDNSYKWAGGGFLSTPSDLVRFAFGHFDDGFLKRETIAELWSPLETNDGESTDYGIGWFVTLEDGEVIRAGHGGGSIGGTTGFLTYPPQRAVVAITGNMSGAPTGGALRQLILDAFIDPGSLVSAPDAPDLAGTYSCTVTLGERVMDAPLILLGTPAAYWGRVADERIVHTASRADGTRIVSVDERGSFTVAHVTATADGGLRGDIDDGRGSADCTRDE